MAVEKIDGTASLKELKAKALAEVTEKFNAKAVARLKSLYEQRRLAKQALQNVDREIADLEQSIEDGSFYE